MYIVSYIRIPIDECFSERPERPEFGTLNKLCNSYEEAVDYVKSDLRILIRDNLIGDSKEMSQEECEKEIENFISYFNEDKPSAYISDNVPGCHQVGACRSEIDGWWELEYRIYKIN